MRFSSITTTLFAAVVLFLPDFSAADNLRRQIQGTCGGENRGNGICPDPSMCCSEFGYCGNGAEYCNGTPVDIPCGGENRGNGVCPDTSMCCSEFGYCGNGADYCGETPVDITCGGGNRGNGICSDPSMCCSEFGYCGNGAEYCDGTPVASPVQAPIVVNPSPTTPIEKQYEDSRLIAYVGNWQPCPSDEQIAQYTHIVIAFAVSYTYSPGKNQCSTTCEIDTPPICGNAARPDLIQKWKGAGKKIILSFGGAGMGGSWAGDNNDCWNYCFGRETQVVNRLTTIVNEMGLDGVDIDYEYFYEDNQNESGFTKGAEAQTFLRDVSLGLRNSMPAGSELTHAPMEPDMVPGKAYFNVLKEVASSLDFLMPQYYNGFVQPNTNFAGALSHFTTITNQIFGGDASKTVFGFCISDCASFNSNGSQSAAVMTKLSETYRVMAVHFSGSRITIIMVLGLSQ
jgi:hypothetical protein